jgi:anti-sigma B factor antagonist
VQSYLSVQVREHGDSVVLRVEGELDLASSPQLADELDRACAARLPRMVVDLEKLQFIDMSGVRVLLSAHRRAEREGIELILTNPRRLIRRVLTLAQVSEVLPIADTR